MHSSNVEADVLKVIYQTFCKDHSLGDLLCQAVIYTVKMRYRYRYTLWGRSAVCLLAVHSGGEHSKQQCVRCHDQILFWTGGRMNITVLGMFW